MVKMRKLKIRWSIPTHTGYYANRDYEGIENDVQNIIANEERLIQRYVEKYYPNAELEIVRVPEVISANNRSRIETDDYLLIQGYDSSGELVTVLLELEQLVTAFVNADGCCSVDFDIDRFISEYENANEG